MKQLIKKFTPEFVLNFYHFSLAVLAKWLYGNPSKKMTVVGVTGTAGKSSTCYFTAQILERAGPLDPHPIFYAPRHPSSFPGLKLSVGRHGRFTRSRWSSKFGRSGTSKYRHVFSRNDCYQFRYNRYGVCQNP